MSVPASIRNRNPGAMWPGPYATKWGATDSEHLADGTNAGAGNEIAYFPTNIQGAAAHFDLLGNAYVGMTIADAIAKWCGHNSVLSYLSIIKKFTGLDASDRLTRDYLCSPKGVDFCQAMAYQEAGQPFPMSRDDWKKAQAFVFGQKPVVIDDSSAKVVVRPATLGERILKRAQGYLGETENSEGGQQDIISWAHMLGHAEIDKADFPWCADFTGAMCVLEGAQVPSPDDALLARAYLSVGKPVDTDSIQPGDIAIWPRAGGMGHVNIVETFDVDSETVVCIGGNQGDGVVSRAPARSVNQALGFRRPVPSKLRPDGTKPVATTVGESPTLKMLLQAKIIAVLGTAYAWWDSITGAVSATVNNLAGTQQQVAQVMDPATAIAQHAGVPMPIKVSMLLVLAILFAVFWRNLRQRQQIQQPLAKALAPVPVESPAQIEEREPTAPASDLATTPVPQPTSDVVAAPAAQ